MFNLYSVKDQKANADENIPYLLDRLGFEQNYFPEFTRLSLRVIAVFIAGALFWYERQVTWQTAYPMVVAAVLGYFGLQGTAWFIKRFVERNAVYIGSKEGNTLYLRTSTPKQTNEYKIECEYKGQTSSFVCKFSDFVDHSGKIVAENLMPLLVAAIDKDK